MNDKRRGRYGQGESSAGWRRLLVVVCGMVAAAVMLAACGGGGDSGSTSADSSSGSTGDVTFGFSLPFGEVPISVVTQNLVKEDAEAKGWSVLIDATKGGNIQEQTATLETWITQGVTAVSVLPTEPSAFDAIAKRAIADGVVWTAYNVEMDEGAGGAVFPPAVTGKVAGEAAVKWINANDPEAEVLVLKAGISSLEERTSVAAEMIEEETKAKIVATQASTEEAKGLQTTETVLQAHPDITVVIGCNDDTALGAAEAFRKAGTKKPSEVFILGEDGTEEALNELLDPQSFFRATVATDLPKAAEEVVNVAARAIENEWQPGDKQEYVEVPQTSIENGDTSLIKEFLAVYEK